MPVAYSSLQLMLFTSLLCSSDVVAAVSIVDYEAQPKLYSCVFGEGVFNDIVSIVLFNVVETLQGKQFTTGLAFIILAQFISLAIVSVGFGILFGFATALLFKHFRFLTISAVIETFIMLAVGFMSYYIAESTVILGLEMSGIIAILTYAIIQSHYTWYNLSPQGKSTTAVTFAFLGHTAEAAIYCYVGLSLYSTIPGYWSVVWCVLQFFVIVIGRIIGVFGVFYLFRLCFKKKTISFKELIFICYGGMIRGAIAFALVLKIPNTCPSDIVEPDEYSCAQYELAKSTTLIVVVTTTLLFGTFMKPFQAWLLGGGD